MGDRRCFSAEPCVNLDSDDKVMRSDVVTHLVNGVTRGDCSKRQMAVWRSRPRNPKQALRKTLIAQNLHVEQDGESAWKCFEYLTHTRAHEHTYTHSHKHIHKHTCTHSHTHTHTHTHTQIPKTPHTTQPRNPHVFTNKRVERSVVLSENATCCR